MKRLLLCCIVAAIVSFLLPTGIGFAAHTSPGTVEVDSGNCPGPGDGSSGDPFCELADALLHSGDGDTILVNSGSFDVSEDASGRNWETYSSVIARGKMDGRVENYDTFKALGAEIVNLDAEVYASLEISGGAVFGRLDFERYAPVAVSGVSFSGAGVKVSYDPNALPMDLESIIAANTWNGAAAVVGTTIMLTPPPPPPLPPSPDPGPPSTPSYRLEVRAEGPGQVRIDPPWAMGRKNWTHINEGVSMTLTPIGDECSQFIGWNGWKEEDHALAKNIESSSLSLQMRRDEKLIAVFETIRYSIAPLTVMGRGVATLKPNSSTIACGNSVELVTKPAERWRVNGVFVNGEKVRIPSAGGSVTWKMMEDIDDIRVKFTLRTAEVVIYPDGPDGKAITKYSDFGPGYSVTLHCVVPEEGKRFVTWEPKNGIRNAEACNTALDLQDPNQADENGRIVLTAQYENAPPPPPPLRRYSLTTAVFSWPPWKEPSCDISAPPSWWRYDKGEKVSMVVRPNLGARLRYWIVDYWSVLKPAWEGDHWLTLTVDRDHTVLAICTP